MSFIDEIKIKVYAGTGGDGATAFRREKYIDRGGPAGGNGGMGGSIIFQGDEGINTLYHFRYKKIIKADNGQKGSSANKNGKNGSDIIIKVPLGTIVYNNSNNSYIGEVKFNNDLLIVAHGGRGGRGNASFKSSKNTAPDFSEKGLPGQSSELRLELKLVADVGIIGLPNAGKSSLIRKLSNAKPKVANYPFTTLEPSLGVCSSFDHHFVLEDIPGLIVDAHKGLGLGFRFLRHIERTKILCHMIDVSNNNYLDNYLNIKNELAQYNEKLIQRPEVIVLNKIDLIDDNQVNQIIKEFKKHTKSEIIAVSVYNNINLDKLVKILSDAVVNLPEVDTFDDFVKVHTIDEVEKRGKLFKIYKDDKSYVIEGDVIHQLFYKTDFNSISSVKRFSYQLKNIGVDNKLVELGAKDGDSVRILDYYFDFIM